MAQIPEKTTKTAAPAQKHNPEIGRSPEESLKGNTLFPKAGEGFFNASKTSFPIQPKLSVNAPNDAYEKEADAVADKVMRMPATGDKEEKLQRKEDDKEMLQAKGGHAPEVTPAFEQSLQSSKGGGSPLPGATRSQMEQGIGADFSNVRVHTGAQAAQLSNSIQAQAFTHGSDIYFNEGKYSPGTDSGKHLLAHELTHTVQQNPGISRKEDKQTPKKEGPKPGTIEWLNGIKEEVNAKIGRYITMRGEGFTPPGALMLAHQKIAESGWSVSADDQKLHNYFGMLAKGKKIKYESDEAGAKAYMDMMATKYNDPLGLYKQNSFNSDQINKELNTGPYINPGKANSYDYDADDNEPTKVKYRPYDKTTHKMLPAIDSGMKDYGRYLMDVAKTGRSKYIKQLTDVTTTLAPYLVNANIEKGKMGEASYMADAIRANYYNTLVAMCNQYSTLLQEVTAIKITDSGTNKSPNKATTTGGAITYAKNILNIAY